MAYQIIARGKSVNFLGRDIGGGLKSLIRNMEACDLEELSIRLSEWLEKESAKLIAKHQEDKVGLLEDRVNCIEIFMRHLPYSKRTVKDLLQSVDNLFQTKGHGITLSSVHKSKGKEWNRVFILGFNAYMPSKYAKKEWQRIQEENLIYVAITRAKNYLGYIEEDCWTDETNLTTFCEKKPAHPDEEPTCNNKGSLMVGFNPFLKQS